jgi:hypothetical protein
VREVFEQRDIDPALHPALKIGAACRIRKASGPLSGTLQCAAYDQNWGA